MAYLLGGIAIVAIILTFVLLATGVIFGAFAIAEGDIKTGVTLVAACALGLSMYAAVGLWFSDDGVSARTVRCGPGTEYRETSESWWCQAR